MALPGFVFTPKLRIAHCRFGVATGADLLNSRRSSLQAREEAAWAFWPFSAGTLGTSFPCRPCRHPTEYRTWLDNHSRPEFLPANSSAQNPEGSPKCWRARTRME